MTATPYCTIDDVRDFGVSDLDASDDRVTRAIARATTKINNFTGQVFGVLNTAETITLDGIVKGTLPLPKPFTNITAVTINGFVLTTDMWEVRDYGIKLSDILLPDADGFFDSLRLPGYSRGWQPWSFMPRIAATVKVTGDFGTADVDPVVTEACIYLAAQFSRMTADDMLPSANITGMTSGGTTFSQAPVSGLTTGNLDVDDMLADFVPGYTMVD